MFLVTGCGRSGTAWAAQMFTELGHPCGHEEVFRPGTERWNLDRNESSWLAVPYVKVLPQDIPIIRIVRDPFDVVASAAVRPFLMRWADPYGMFVRRHYSQILEPPDAVGRAIRWATMWDWTLDMVPHRVLRSDAPFDSPQFVSAITYATGQSPDPAKVREILERTGRRVNAGNRLGRPTREQILRHPEGWRVEKRAEEFGYGS